METYREDGHSREETFRKVQEKYQLTRQKTEEYMNTMVALSQKSVSQTLFLFTSEVRISSFTGEEEGSSMISESLFAAICPMYCLGT